MERRFSTEGLERGIQQARKNIRIFEEAIKKEEATIADYMRMIEFNRKQEGLVDEAQRSIQVERDDDTK